MPLPAQLRRLGSAVVPYIAWVAALAFATLLYATLPSAIRPLLGPPRRTVDLQAWQRLAIGFLAAAPIAYAARRPVLALGTLLAEVTAGAVAGLHSPWSLLAVALLVFVVAATGSRGVSCTAAAVAVGALAGQEAFLTPGGSGFLIGGQNLNVLLAIAVALAAGILVRERREHGAALRRQTAQQAVTAERLRIARELHDMVAHSVGVVAIQAGAAKRVIDSRPEKAREALAVIEQTSRETLAGLRHMLGALRQADADVEDSVPALGLADLDRLLAGVAHPGLRIELSWSGKQRALSREVDLAAFRIVQESVTNVVRHAAAGTCLVHVAYRERELGIEVLDDGRGFAVRGSVRHASSGHSAPAELDRVDGEGLGYGIAGMRERVSLLGGHFAAGPRPEGGFRVAAGLPA